VMQVRLRAANAGNPTNHFLIIVGFPLVPSPACGGRLGWGPLRSPDARLWDLDRCRRRFLDLRLWRRRRELGSGRVAHLRLAGVWNHGIGFHRI
jgi:hypothetical protein